MKNLRKRGNATAFTSTVIALAFAVIWVCIQSAELWSGSLAVREGREAPVTVRLLLLFLTCSARTGGLRLGDAVPEPMMALTLSNQSAAAYLPGSFRGQRNRLAADRLGE